MSRLTNHKHPLPMDTKVLEKFAQAARRQLHEQVAARLQRVLTTDSAELRGQAAAVKQLKAVAAASQDAVVERVAYTWFNRFCALRYMDVNHYTRMGTVSPAEGFTQPEILQEAKQGHIDDDLPVDRERVLGLLGGRLPSRDPQQEAYRLLLVASCNQLHTVMPFLFEPIADYTELLMPGDLLSEGSVLQSVRDAMTPEACQDVEVIGWLYQFYISEKKDAVIGAKQPIAAEDIPAATQLFTPHWIVRFLVENSLGRLWLLNRPQSRLAEQMPYYIAPKQRETDFLRVTSPEELTVCDPAAGSGHMLTYAFDLLYAIYAEEGYNPVDIPRLILEKNLYGMEIDERAGDLAAFALAMKARAKDRRFFSRSVRPHICVYQPLTFSDAEVKAAPWLPRMEGNLLDLPLLDALLVDLQALGDLGLVGSLLRPQLSVDQIVAVRERIGAAEDLFSHGVNERVRVALDQLEYLARRYHVVIANPPYMGGKNMNDELKQFLSDGYNDVKSDLFAAFTVRIIERTLPGGFIGMMTPFNWMFLSSFEKLREKMLHETTLTCLVRPEFHAFFDSAYVTVCGFTLFTRELPDFEGAFIDLDSFYGAELQPLKALEAIANPACGWFYRAAAADFAKIPGSPIAYWVSERFADIVQRASSLESIVTLREGLTTGNNELFLRLWHEVAGNQLKFGATTQTSAQASGCRWFPYNKGGTFRKWYGNNEFVVNWFDRGREIHEYAGVPLDFGAAPVRAKQHYFNPGITWTRVSSATTAFRAYSHGFVFDSTAPSIFPDKADICALAALLNGKPIRVFLEIVAPTLDFRIGPVSRIPVVETVLAEDSVITTGRRCVAITKTDWGSYETSWDFADLPLLRAEFRRATLAETCAALGNHWQAMTLEMQRLEEENNRLFIEAYGLHDELTPDVPLREITLTCNPHYRYGDKRSAEELEALLLADTLREFISYAVGCMFGRFSLDKPGVILANQGETVEDYLRQIPHPTFPPDKDNVLPILDGDWFADDIVARFQRFLRVTFGDERYSENLAFIEQALGRDLRSYFLRDFYADHVKRYQKRPIYWLFSSPKGSFNALVYMHRYRHDTVSVVLNDYLREFRAKLSARKAHLQQVGIRANATARDKTAAIKEIDKIDKVLKELTDYENDILYPLATQQIAIDLDDGVKVNYPKFGKALKKIAGLEG